VKNTKTKTFNPAWLTPVSDKDLKLSRGKQVADFINTFCIQIKSVPNDQQPFFVLEVVTATGMYP